MSPILAQIDQLLTSRKQEILDWIEKRTAEAAPHIYTSVDLRHSGHKIAPVDTNLFPAGFHVMSPAALRRAVEQFTPVLSPYKNVLLMPENHTRNLAYLDNVAMLADLLNQSGVTCRVGSFTATDEPLTLTSQSGKTVIEAPILREKDRIKTADGFVPDLVLLNNDLTAGMPEILRDLKQPVMPPPDLGWWKRRKSQHFTAYERIAKQFAEHFEFDPWLISAMFQQCGKVDFAERSGIECVAKNADWVLHQVRRKYEQYDIKEKPYVFIKADSGTYGMGIMTAHSGEELFEMNKKTRNKMKVIKEGAENTEVIIQEGIPSIDRVGTAFAEPMIYLVRGTPIGGAYRSNPERDAESNLNATGMVFTGMCDEWETGQDAKVKIADCNFCVFGLIARLAALAAARE